jgi:hypothetical protein
VGGRRGFTGAATALTGAALLGAGGRFKGGFTGAATLTGAFGKDGFTGVPAVALIGALGVVATGFVGVVPIIVTLHC